MCKLNREAPVLTLRQVILLPRQNHTKPKLRTNLRPSPGGPHVMSVRGRQEGVTPSYPIKPVINALPSWEQLSRPQWHMQGCTEHASEHTHTYTHTHTHTHTHTDSPDKNQNAPSHAHDGWVTHVCAQTSESVRQLHQPDLFFIAHSVFTVQFMFPSAADDEAPVSDFVLAVKPASGMGIFIFPPALMTFITNQCKSNFRGLKGKFIQKWEFSWYLLTPMPMEGQMKFCSPLNIYGASQQNSVAPTQLK